MSIERQVKFALWRLSFWKFVVSVARVPEDLFRALGHVLRVFETFFDELGKVAFGYELDAARRYYALTGLDLADATGDEDRYRGVRVAAGTEERLDDDEEDDE